MSTPPAVMMPGGGFCFFARGGGRGPSESAKNGFGAGFAPPRS
ncbi:Hypothetical protein A7982_10387 [Minicystis rosea]|nr:Hypothetical protein A7982_10387 [Minicystis rosea]